MKKIKLHHILLTFLAAVVALGTYTQHYIVTGKAYDKRWANPANTQVVTKDGEKFAIAQRTWWGGWRVSEHLDDYASAEEAERARRWMVNASAERIVYRELSWREVTFETNVTVLTNVESVEIVQFSPTDDSTTNSPTTNLVEAPTN